MTKPSDQILPLLHFLTGELDELSGATPGAVRAVAKRAGFDRAPLAARIRDSVITSYREKGEPVELRDQLTIFGVDALNELAGANMSRLNLKGANLRGANLHSVDLREAILAQASLGGAILSEAQLDQADLRGADFSQAIIVGASFSGATITAARGLPTSINNAVLVTPEIRDLLRHLREAALSRDGDVINDAAEQILIGEWAMAEQTLDAILRTAPEDSELRQHAQILRALLSALKDDLRDAQTRLSGLE
jgi:uncharacterized protein YjbI with pentapeptide repeats